VRWRAGQDTSRWRDPGANPLSLALDSVTDVAAAEKLLEAVVKQAAVNGIAEDVAVEVLSSALVAGGLLDRMGVGVARSATTASRRVGVGRGKGKVTKRHVLPDTLHTALCRLFFFFF
jgi:hypothetical protein